MPVSPDFTSSFIKHWEIYFSQCYPNAALKLPEMSNLLQLTAAAHADMCGVGFLDLVTFDQSWVMNRMRIEIEKLPKWRDVVEIKTWIEELKDIKSIRNFEVSFEGEKYIGVSTMWVIFNTNTRRPDNLKIDTDHVERFPSLHATATPTRKLSFDFDIEESYQYEVQFSDLDIVRHANNVKYLEWCLNYLDANIILENRIKTIELNFIKELSLGDVVTICKGTENNITKFKILRDDLICFVCDIEIKA